MPHVEVRGQLLGGGSLLLPCEAWGLNSGLQAWLQAPCLLGHFIGPGTSLL